MGNKTYLRTERGMRIDQPDFDHAARVSQRDGLNAIVDGFLVGQDPDQAVTQPRAYIIRGFDVTGLATTVVTITKGVNGTAILGFREGGATQQGCVLTQGQASKAIDIVSFPDATYQVFIRFVFRDSNFTNRLFWNATAPTPVEFPRNIPTRVAEDWDVVIEQVSPGAEWIRIAEVDKAGGTITDVDDVRDLFFEGNAFNGFEPVDAEWGSASDRLDTRGANGVFGFRRFVRSVYRQIQDIIGDSGNRWWVDAKAGSASSGVGPRSLTALNAEKLGLVAGAAFKLAGILTPDGDGTRDLGSAIARFQDVFCLNVEASTQVNTSAVNATATITGQDLVATNSVSQDFAFFDATANPAPGANVQNRQFANSIVKLWATVDVGVGGPTIVDGLNIASVAYVGTGTAFLEVSFAQDMADGNYAVWIGERNSLGEAGALHVFGSYSKAVGSFRILARDLATAALTQLDTTALTLHIKVLGEQA